jgi:hypothetical protein
MPRDDDDDDDDDDDYDDDDAADEGKEEEEEEEEEEVGKSRRRRRHVVVSKGGRRLELRDRPFGLKPVLPMEIDDRSDLDHRVLSSMKVRKQGSGGRVGAACSSRCATAKNGANSTRSGKRRALVTCVTLQRLPD